MSRCRGIMVDLGRRQFLKGSGLAAAGAASGALMGGAGHAEATPALARVDYPGKRLANIRDLAVNEAMEISYPDESSPGVLIKLGAPAVNGVGPDGDIVAFSTLCPHKGFPLSYVAAEKILNCPGHFSRFDVEKGGQEVWGHATQNLPQFVLTLDDQGDIRATGADELIYGRLSNVL